MWGTKRHSLPYWVPSSRYLRDADPEEIEIARERARRGAALIARSDPEKRAEAERIFGIDYMKHRYPEAYASPKHFLDYLRWWSTS